MIEESLYYQITNDSAVAAVLGDRLFPVVVPAGTDLPNATYQLITETDPATLDGTVGLLNATFQVSVWATTYDVAKNLANLVRTALKNVSGTIASMDVDRMAVSQVRDLSWISDENEQQSRYGRAIDVAIFYRE